MRVKPTKDAVMSQQRLLMSERHAKRLASGRKESHPDDFQMTKNPEELARARARRRLEDLALARELGVDPANL